ncbi:MAG: polysaccharide biosynthesis/export family protein [Planctomycetota bacterium]
MDFPSSPPRTTIDPGMLLEFRFFYQPELNDTQEVRADGAVALALVGDVQVAGLTPSQAQERIRVLLEKQIANPDVTVIVRRTTPTNVFVGGEVNTPGAVPFDVRLTVFEALMMAGGFNLDLANVRNVLVIRDGGDRRQGYAIDLQAELEGGRGTAFRLQPRDIVYVPRTEIADVNLWISQNINKMVPQLGVSYSAPVGNGTAAATTAIRR